MTPLLANASAELVREWSFTASEVFWQAVIVLAIVLLNAFFVAAEFAIVKVRDSQLQAAIDDGTRGAKFAQTVTRNLDAYLSAGQLGITLTSIALGIFGEPFVAVVVQPMLFKMGIVNETVIRWTSIGIAYAIVTYLHVVLGEQTPKVVAIRKSLPTALLIARPLHLFYLVLKPAIWILSASTNVVLRFLGIAAVSEHEIAHSEEELRHIVAESQKSKEVTETEKDILLNALALNDRCVRDVMTPRNQVVSLDADETFEASLKIAIDSKHTRYPLVEGHLDHAIGTIHIKDLLGLIGTNSHAGQLKGLLSAEGILLDCLVEDPAYQTIVKTRIIARNQQVVRVDREKKTGLTPLQTAQALGQLGNLIDQIDGIIIEDYAKGLLNQELVDAIVTKARAAGKIVTVDPNPNNHLSWSGVTAVKPNRSEAFAAAGLAQSDPVEPATADTDLLQAGQTLLDRWNTESVLVTLSEQGIMLFQRNAAPFHIPTRAQEVFDVSGAGDTAIALFTLALCAGASATEAAVIANHAAGIVVGKLGTATLSPAELLASFK